MTPDSSGPGSASSAENQPLRVLHVLEAVRGGTSRHVADLVRHATGAEHVVAVAAPGGDTRSGALYDHRAVAAIRRCGARVVAVPMHRTPWHPANAAGAARLRRLIAAERVAVVHGHSSVGGALARLAAAGRPEPVVYTPNGVATGRPYLALERALGRMTDRWVAVSASEAEAALRLGLTSPDRLVIVPNGIDLLPPPPGADLRARLGLDPAAPLVGTVARLVPQKAPQRFVRLAARVADGDERVQFVLIGAGPLQASVDTEVRNAGLQTRWHQIEHLDDASAVLGQLDVFVLASDFEGAPYTPLEAMRARTPVVLSDVVGNRDAVHDGVSGFLRAPEDVDGMAEAVLRLLSDGPLRRDLTVRAADRLARHFDAAAMGRRMLQVYAGLAEAPPADRRSTRRLPQPSEESSVQSPDSIAAQ